MALTKQKGRNVWEVYQSKRLETGVSACRYHAQYSYSTSKKTSSSFADMISIWGQGVIISEYRSGFELKLRLSK